MDSHLSNAVSHACIRRLVIFLAQFEIWVFWKIEAVFQKLQFLENAKEISLKIWFLIFKNDKKWTKITTYSNRSKKISKRRINACDTAFERWESILSENSSARAPRRARSKFLLEMWKFTFFEKKNDFFLNIKNFERARRGARALEFTESIDSHLSNAVSHAFRIRRLVIFWNDLSK